jgi:hypothetical protein
MCDPFKKIKSQVWRLKWYSGSHTRGFLYRLTYIEFQRVRKSCWKIFSSSRWTGAKDIGKVTSWIQWVYQWNIFFSSEYFLSKIFNLWSTKNLKRAFWEYFVTCWITYWVMKDFLKLYWIFWIKIIFYILLQFNF